MGKALSGELLCLCDKSCFQGTQEGVGNSRGKRAISVRATEVLLYYQINFQMDRQYLLQKKMIT